MQRSTVQGGMVVAKYMIGRMFRRKPQHELLLLEPNTIQQDIHPDIRPAGNSPAEYSAGTYFSLSKRKSHITVKMTPVQHNGIPRASKISN